MRIRHILLLMSNIACLLMWLMLDNMFLPSANPEYVWQVKQIGFFSFALPLGIATLIQIRQAERGTL